MSNDTLHTNLNTIVEELTALRVIKKYKDEFDAIAGHLAAAEALDHRETQTLSFTGPQPDGTILLARLVSGDDVSDVDLIAYAAQKTSAGANIGSAARDLLGSARTARLKSARDVLRPIFDSIIADLRASLPAAGEKPAESVIQSLRVALEAFQEALGGWGNRRVANFWLIRNYRTDEWKILERDDAETLKRANDSYIAEQQRLERERRANGPTPIRAAAGQKSYSLRRRPVTGSGVGDTTPTLAEVEAYQASKERDYWG